MAAVTFGATGLQFGLTDETGCAVISISRNATSGRKEVSEAQGDIIGRGSYGFKAEYRIAATSYAGNNGSNASGIMAAGVGTTYALANFLSLNGVTGGVFILDTAEIAMDHEDFQKFNATGTQYPAI
jgi:hypothetical protein